MNGLYRQFKTDPKAETEGIVLEYGTNSKGLVISFRVRRSGGENKSYEKGLVRDFRPLKSQIKADILDNEQAKAVAQRTFIDTCLIGWDNVEDENDQPIAFSKDAALKLFKDLPDLYLDIQEQAGKVSLFRAEIRKADAGN